MEDSEPGAAQASNPPPAAPPAFARWLTVVATLVVGAILVGGVWARRRAAPETSGTSSLSAFDAKIGYEPVDKQLSKAVGRDAEQFLRSAIASAGAGAEAASDTARGARDRLAIVLGEAGRWDEAAGFLPGDVDGAAFSALVTCAYGAERRGCDATPVCDEATSAALTRDAGTWSAARACVVAAGRAHDTITPKRLVAEQAPRLRHRQLSQRVDGAGLLVGLVAAGILIARRRRPRREPPAPPAPWPRGQLYAALVRSLLWSILLAAMIAGAMGKAHHAPSGAITLLIYLLLLLWMARLVFRRFGLSWRDSLAWPPAGAARDVGLTLLATIGLGRAGSACVALIATAAGIHVPWSDMTQPLDPTAPLRLALSVVSTVVMPALTEELLFRRAIFAALRRRWTPPIAALVSAALFALPHGYSWIGLAMMFWLGLVAAWAFNRTGSLWPCIGAHAYGNAIAVWASVI